MSSNCDHYKQLANGYSALDYRVRSLEEAATDLCEQGKFRQALKLLTWKESGRLARLARERATA